MITEIYVSDVGQDDEVVVPEKEPNSLPVPIEEDPEIEEDDDDDSFDDDEEDDDIEEDEEDDEKKDEDE